MHISESNDKEILGNLLQMIPQIPLLKDTLTEHPAHLDPLPRLIQLQDRVPLLLDPQHQHQLLLHTQRLSEQQSFSPELVLLVLSDLLYHPKDGLSARAHQGQTLRDLAYRGNLRHAQRVDQDPPVKLGQEPGSLALQQEGLLAPVVGFDQSERVLGKHGVFLDRAGFKGVEGQQLALGGRADEGLVLGHGQADDGGGAYLEEELLFVLERGVEEEEGV